MESVKKECELAIICPVVNCLEYTKQVIETIKTKRDYRLIIINNGSNDGTEAYLKTLSKSGKIGVINFPTNIGVAGAWNCGIDKAMTACNSNKFLVINNDIVLRKDTIDTLIENMQCEEIAIISATDVAWKDHNPHNVHNYEIPDNKKITDDPDFSCFMIKKETIKKIGWFDEKYYPAYFEDNDYHYRIKLQNKRAVKLNQAIYFHYGSMTIRENVAVQRLSNSTYMDNKEYFRKKWGGYPGQEIYTTAFNR